MATGKELQRLRPQEQALVRVADGLGIVQYSDNGGVLINLGDPRLKEQLNVLAPATTMSKADANFTPAISVVTLEQGDFYPTGKGDNTKYALSKVQLDQIAKVAGIEDIGPEIVYFGADHQNLRITWTARMRRPDGTWQMASGSREWVELDEKEKLYASVPDWVTKSGPADTSNPTYNKWWADNWLGIQKKHRMGNTETKARLRAYRSLLTVKGGYTKAETQKPFLIASTSFTPDTSDIRVLGMMMQQGQQAQNLLYGPSDDTGEAAAPEAVIEVEGHEAPAHDADGVVIETHGEKPGDDLKIPKGPHAGEMLSEVARTDPEYTLKTFAGSSEWGPVAEQWRAYWHGEAGDISGIDF